MKKLIYLLSMVCISLFCGCSTNIQQDSTIDNTVGVTAENSGAYTESLELYYPNGNQTTITFNWNKKELDMLQGPVKMYYYADANEFRESKALCIVGDGTVYYRESISEEWEVFSGSFSLRTINK